MLYNAQRTRVADWQAGQISTCPDCQGSLFGRRGEIVVWHWAHYPNGVDGRARCGHVETAWHLQWKTAYDQLPNWTVETNISGFRVDAINPKTGQIREFIHSLSPYYRVKHQCLAALDYEVRWLFDGQVFVSARTRHLNPFAFIQDPLARANQGMCHFLKASAYQLHCLLGRRCWVHWQDALWKEWKENVWYPRTDERAARVLAAFQAAEQRLVKITPRT